MPELTGERMSGEELHHDVGLTIGSETVIVEVHEVGVLELGHQTGFAKETLADLLGEFVVISRLEELDRGAITERRVDRLVHDREAALPDFALDAKSATE
jgi:hypothetical protein